RPPIVCFTASTGGATSAEPIVCLTVASTGGGPFDTVGCGAGEGGASSGLAGRARGSAMLGRSVGTKVGVAKERPLTTSSELSSAWGRTLKAPGEPVTTPTCSPRGKTPSLPEV